MTRSAEAGRSRCRVFLFGLLVVLGATGACAAPQGQAPRDIVGAYIHAWADFYPSRAFFPGRNHLLVRDQLSRQERSEALAVRLAGVRSLCVFAVGQPNGGTRPRTERALSTLAASRRFYREDLPELVADWPQADTLFCIPATPDSADESTEEGFYRSFNDRDPRRQLR